MADQTYVFIDGESHFVRSQSEWQNLHGSDASLQQLRYVGDPDFSQILVIEDAKVFWTRRMNPGVRRTFYISAVNGDEPRYHDVQVEVRNFNLEPMIVRETRELRRRRDETLTNLRLIEKPKGVDIRLAVTMMRFADTFQECHLYTSDVDFIPVIEYVMSKGVDVIVHGYSDGTANRSPLLHIPRRFIDLSEMLRNECELAPPNNPNGT